MFHKICAMTALFFSILHSIGHLVNFYHVGTQPVEHLLCLSKELNFGSDQKPDIAFWLFQVILIIIFFRVFCPHVVISRP